jgi:hypothetical protein
LGREAAGFRPDLHFGFILSGIMFWLASGLSTFRALGIMPDLPLLWLGNWRVRGATAFANVLKVAPTGRIVGAVGGKVKRAGLSPRAFRSFRGRWA